MKSIPQIVSLHLPVYVYILPILQLISVILFIISLSGLLINKIKQKNENKVKKINKIFKILLIISIVLLVASIIIPYIFAKPNYLD